MSNTKEITDIQHSVAMKNILATQEFAKETRTLMRNLEEELSHVRNISIQQGLELETLRKQVQQLLIKTYSGGTSSGN